MRHTAQCPSVSPTRRRQWVVCVLLALTIARARPSADGRALATEDAPAPLVTLSAVEDASLKAGSPNAHLGLEPRLVVRNRAAHRALIRFDLGGLVGRDSAGRLEGAHLELFVEANGDNWGPEGREVELHRLTVPWSEAGATWNCPEDRAPDHHSDCEGTWRGGAYAPEVAARALHRNGLLGWVSFDVTDEVREFLLGAANHGWVIVGEGGRQNGRVEYASREGLADRAPRLVLSLAVRSEPTPTVPQANSPTKSVPGTGTATATEAGRETATLADSPSVTVTMSRSASVTATATTSPSATASHSDTPTPTAIRSGALFGEVFDDESALPLPGAHASSGAAVDASEGQGPLPVAGSDGRYLLELPPGERCVQVTKAGYTGALRCATVEAGRGTRVLDARLTRRSEAVPLGAAGGALRARLAVPVALGVPAGEGASAPPALPAAGARTLELALVVAPDAFPGEVRISLTALGPQGLVHPAPPGWSVLLGAEVRVAGEALREEDAPWASLHVPLDSLSAWDTSPDAIVAAVWDEAQRVWLRAAAPERDGTDLIVRLPVPAALGEMHVALVAADSLDLERACGANEALPSPDATPGAWEAAALTVVPDVIVAGSNARALARFALAWGSGPPLASGAVVETTLQETYDLRSGGVLAATPSRQDFLGYRLSPAGSGGALNAFFPLSPGLRVASAQLREGRVAVDLLGSDTGAGDPALIDESGGSVVGPGGVALFAPPGLVSGKALVSVSPRSAPAGLPPSPALAAVLSVDLSGASLDCGAGLAFALGDGVTVADGESFAVAGAAVVDGSRVWRLVAFAVGIDGRVVLDDGGAESLGCPEGLGGTYAFFRLPAHGHRIGGRVTDVVRGPRSGLPVSSDGLPVVSVTDGAGRYLLPAPPGVASIVTATDSANDLVGTRSVAAPPPETRALLFEDIELVGSPPRVLEVAPANHRADVSLDATLRWTFSEPVLPASVTSQSVRVGQETTDGAIAPVSGRLSLASGDTMVMFTPARPLLANALYRLTVDGVTDRGGAPARFESDFTTAAAFPAAALAAGGLRVSLPNADGLVAVCGGAGLAAPGTEVSAHGRRGSGATVTATREDGTADSVCIGLAGFDGFCDVTAPGSFCTVVPAEFGERVSVLVEDALGARVTIEGPAQRDPDTGTTAVGPEGASVVAVEDSRYRVVVPEGAFDEVVSVRVSPRAPEALPPGDGVTVVAAVEVDIGGGPAALPLLLRVPAPAGTTTEDQFVVVRPVNVRGVEELTAVDTASLDRQTDSIVAAGGVYDPALAVFAGEEDGGADAGGALAGLFAPARAVAQAVPSAGPALALPLLRESGLVGVVAATDCTAYVTGYASVASRLDQSGAYVVAGTGGILPFPLLRVGPTRFTVPAPCDRPLQVSLQNGRGPVDFLSLSTVPRKGQFVFVSGAVSDDHAPPSVVAGQLSIPDGATRVGHDAAISVPFSEQVASASLNGGMFGPSPLRLICNGSPVKGGWSQSADGRRAYFVTDAGRPLHGLPLGARCRIEVGAGPTDLSQNRMTTPFATEFETFAPGLLSRFAPAAGLNAQDVAAIGWYPAGSPPSYRQYVAVAEADTDTVRDFQRGLLFVDVADSASPFEWMRRPTESQDYAVRYVPAEPISDAQGRMYGGPYLLAVAGPGDRVPSFFHREFGTFHLFDLAGFPAAATEIFRRDVNHSAESFALFNASSPVEEAGLHHLLRVIPNALGVPVDVTNRGAQAAYLANTQGQLGLQGLRIAGFGPPALGDVAGLASVAQVRSVAALKEWVIAGRADGLVVADAQLGQYGQPYPIENATWLLPLPDWPIDCDRDGHIAPGEVFDIVVAPCDDALCALNLDAAAGQFVPRGCLRNGRIRLPANATVRGAVADSIRRLIYVASGTAGVSVVDAQDLSGSLDDDAPFGVDDRVLYSLPLGGTHARRISYDVDEGGRTVGYVAAGEGGLYLVDLGPARMQVGLVRQVEYAGGSSGPKAGTVRAAVPVDEVRYFNEKAETLYQPEIALPGHLAERYGDHVSVVLETVDLGGARITPPAGNLAPAEQRVVLDRVPGTSRYSWPRDAQGGFAGRVLAVTNLPLEERDGSGALVGGLEKLRQEYVDPSLSLVPLYGGIGTRVRLRALVGEPLEGREHEVPVEKVDVVLFAIDGLRQDVLYPESENEVQEPQMKNAAGESFYRVEPAELPGFGQLLGGRLVAGAGGSAKVAGDLDAHHVRLPSVSAIFPSITLASWASILTGRPPRETGITGNEFFTRGAPRGLSLREQRNDPVITLSEGAWSRTPSESANLEPAGGGVRGFMVADAEIADQNRRELLTAPTIFEQLDDLRRDPRYGLLAERFPDGNRPCDGRPGDGLGVIAFNHYARGSACWLTMSRSQSLSFAQGGTAQFNDIPAQNTLAYLDANLRDPATGKRNGQAFPAFLAVYLAGLDEHAHEHGHGADAGHYTSYLRQSLDPRVADVVRGLRELDEFYNKIFLVTADHGHSRISDDAGGTYPCYLELGSKLGPLSWSGNWLENMEREDVRDREASNRNLHIWELARVLAVGNEIQNAYHPTILLSANFRTKALRALGDAARFTTDSTEATLVATLNGAMAHIYLRDSTTPPSPSAWTTRAPESELATVAEVLRLYLTDGQRFDQNGVAAYGVGTAHPRFRADSYVTFTDLVTKRGVTSLRSMQGSADLILIRLAPGAPYLVFNGLMASADPQSIRAETIDFQKLLTVSSFGQEYVDAVTRVDGLNHFERSGDIILLMRGRTGDVESARFTTGVACRGWHAGLNRADSYVPFIMSYPGGSGGEVWGAIRGLCLPPLGGGKQNCRRNWLLPELVRDILRKGYAE